MKYVENIKRRVRAAENRAAIIYAQTDGKLYKWLKRLYVFCMVISVITSLLYVSGRASRLYEIERLNLEIMSDTAINAVKQSIITVSICTAVFLIAMVLIKFKAEIVSLVLTLGAGIVSGADLIAASTGTAQFNQGINDNFWYRHFIPFILALFFIVWMVIVKYRAHFKFKRAYTNMVNRIYSQYHAEDLSEEEWESFLADYDPRAEEEKLRREKQKAKKEK